MKILKCSKEGNRKLSMEVKGDAATLGLWLVVTHSTSPGLSFRLLSRTSVVWVAFATADQALVKPRLW